MIHLIAYTHCKHHKRILLTVVMWLISTTSLLKAQEFVVRTFRSLPNDITAYIQPVKDLNEEACALIKIVGSTDYAFSTPLGIVKRQHEIGEIWLYVPKGSVQITIKHPQWGVLRDYQWGFPLESRMTYELVLMPKNPSYQPQVRPLKDKPVPYDTLIQMPARLTAHPQPPVKRPKERWCRLLMVQAGIGSSKPTFGTQWALMRRHGAYLSWQYNFQSLPGTEGSCQKDGLWNEQGVYPYYTGRTQEQQFSILAGAIHRIYRELCLYEGAGYGKRSIAWEMAGKSWLLNDGLSAKGISAEIGLLWRFQHWAIAGGVQTLAGKYWKGTFAIGIQF